MNKMKKCAMCAFAASVAVALVFAPLHAATLGPEWCVTYPVEAPEVIAKALKIAAEEVCDDINEATGLRLKAVPASKAKRPAIWIGAEAAKKAGFDLTGMERYDNAIAEKDGNIYLFGNDKVRTPAGASAAAASKEWYTSLLPSVKAATRFLEDYVGVRFLMPGENGKEVPKRDAVSLPDGTLSKESPSMVYGNGRSRMNRSLIYMIANGRWGMGMFHTYGGHSYPRACHARKYFKDHPEYFGLINGKRHCASRPQYSALCISNPDVEQLMIEELKRQFDMGAEVCQLAQQDSMLVCECDNCRAMFGTGDDWDEKLWCFHRKIAERMLKERPGKVVHILSYHRTAHPPKTFKVFPSNVMIELCNYSEEAFRKWKDYTVPRGFTVYSYLCGDYVQPGLVARHSFAYYAMLAKRFRENKVHGVFRCGGHDLYGTEGPGYYVFNKLLLDGSLNVKSLVSDYCQAAFGPAAKAMRKFYEKQDERTRMFDRIYEAFPVDSAPGLDGYVNIRPTNSLDLHGYMFSPETTAKMESALSKAEKTKGLSAKQKRRIKLARLEFDYAKNMGAISTLYSAYKLRPTKVSLAPLLDALKERNAMLDRIYGGGKYPKCIEGWPEVTPFGSKLTRDLMTVNGRLTATIISPLTWPDTVPDGVLPGVGVKSAPALRVATPPTFDGFAEKDGWNKLCGKLTVTDMNAGFKAMYDDFGLYLLVENDRPDENVKGEDYIVVTVAPGSTRDVHYRLLYGMHNASRTDSATGLVTDQFDPAYGKPDNTWEGKGWKVERRRENGKWLSIVTLPYSDFGVAAPKPGDSWFINVETAIKTNKNLKKEVPMIWSPLEYRNMPAKEAMGKILFK